MHLKSQKVTSSEGRETKKVFFLDDAAALCFNTLLSATSLPGEQPLALVPLHCEPELTRFAVRWIVKKWIAI